MGFTFSPAYMKKTKAILFLFLLSLTGSAQVVFKTIAPVTPVVAGESFRIQYYVEGAPAHELTPPDFTPFTLVEGPAVYPGSSKNAGILYKNYIYTLLAPQPGEYRIPGASLRTGNNILQSSVARISVISAARSLESATIANGPTGYFLGRDENAQEKIRRNLFLQVTTDRKSCFVGEPILVTYKLYSTLQSTSTIMKNPGFYGFTVHDMIGLDNQQMSTEQVNGKEFNVFVIRKLQLYPLQAGRFTIDPMEVKNRVEFSTTEQNRQTQQRVAEGMMSGNEEEPRKEGQLIVESQIRTEPAAIEVKPLPDKNKPSDFSGAVGAFSLTTQLERTTLARNEEGVLLVTITGKGNFIQLSPPVIEWPAGMEGFGAVVKDSLDKLKIPLAGKRQFRYGFVCTAPGVFTLPVVRFSFFDTDSNRYRSQVADALQVTISQQEKKQDIREQHKLSIDELSQQKSRIAIIVVFLLVISVLAYWALKKKPAEQNPAVAERVKPETAAVFAPAETSVQSAADIFCTALLRNIWDYFQPIAAVTGSARNKENLYALLRESGIAAEEIDTLAAIISDCETGIYTHAVPGKSNEQLLAETKAVIERLSPVLF